MSADTEDEALYCLGCGAKLQTTDETKPGYVPAGAYATGKANGTLYCRRCFKLRHYNTLEKVTTSAADFAAILNGIAAEDALVVNVVDLFDIAGSLLPGIRRLTGQNDLILVANKTDLLPKGLNQNRLTNAVKKLAKDRGIRVRDVLLTSAVTAQAVDDLFNRIDKLRRGRDVYIVGAANVGKSTLVNALLKSRGIQGEWITTSQYPGTTLDIIEIPLDDDSALIDTPGVMHDGQLTAHLSLPSLQTVLPTERIRPRAYQLNADQTLFFGGLARIDYKRGEKQGLTVYASNRLSLHRRKTDGADAFYQRHAGELLVPPSADDDAFTFHYREFTVPAATDIVVAGLGWVTLSKAGTVGVYAPTGVDVTVRAALI